MLFSNNFQTTIFTWDDKNFKMEYDLRASPDGNSAFGNIYINGENDEPNEFTFFTVNGRVAGYTPMNGKKEYIGAIVETILGIKLPIDNMF